MTTALGLFIGIFAAVLVALIARKRLTNQYGASDAVYAQEQSGQFRVEVRIPARTEATA